MLTSGVWDSAAAARDYFTTGLSREDYFLDDAEPMGRWYGKAAERLGLPRVVNRRDFVNVSENRHPQSGEKLTPRMRSDRRVAYEFCLTCPKSISITYYLTGDTRLLEAVLESNRYAMGLVEASTQTRVRRGGVSEDKVTSNLVWAEFLHLMGRPVKGVPDPLIHVHNYVPNTTFDDVEGRWKAVQLGLVKRHMTYYQAEFFCDLARRVRELGYGVEKVNGSFELAGMPRSLIEKFSNRTSVIKAHVENRGIEDARDRANAGKATREAKNRGLSMEAIRAAWQARLTPDDWETLRTLKSPANAERGPLPLHDAVARAIDEVFQRSADIRESVLVAEAMMQDPGRFTADETRQEAKRQGVKSEKHRGEDRARNAERTKDEDRLLRAVKAGRGKHRPTLAVPSEGSGLTPEEMAAARHILLSTDLVTIVRAAPGADLGRVMKFVHDEVRRVSLRGVEFFAPSKAGAAQVAKDVNIRKVSSFFTLKEAESVFKLLHDEGVKRKSTFSYLWVHEAGHLGVKEAANLVALAKRHFCRVVLSTGSFTERSATRGNVVDFLEREGAVRPNRMRMVTAPLAEHRRSLQLFNSGRYSAAVRKLDNIGCIRESESKVRAKTIADRYVELSRGKQTVVAVAHNREEKRRLSEAIRERRRETGQIRSEGRHRRTLVPVEMSQAERMDPKSFRKGMIIEFHQKTLGFKPGSRWKVTGHDPAGRVIARRYGWDLVTKARPVTVFETMPLGRAKSFGVYEQSRIRVAKGDWIRATKNYRADGWGKHGKIAPIDWIRGARTRDVNAGDIFRVKGVTLRGKIVRDDGLKLDRSFEHFEYAYSATLSELPKRRVDHVLMSGSSWHGMADANVLSSWMAKAKKFFTIYTDDKQGFMDQVAKSEDRTTKSAVREDQAKERLQKMQDRARASNEESAAREQARRQERGREREKER